MNMIDYYNFGSALYVPAVHKDLKQILSGTKIPKLKTVVVCFEDSIFDNEVSFALDNFQEAIASVSTDSTHPNIFIRPRNVLMADKIVHLLPPTCLQKVVGLALAKFNIADLDDWIKVTRNTHLLWMPILETQDVFDVQHMNSVAHELKEKAVDRIALLRIGGNDLLNVLSLRRGTVHTLYEGVMGQVIRNLMTIFVPQGFKLSAPVCELIDYPEILKKEVMLDIEHGLVGKTLIHPKQIDIIEDAFKVEVQEYDEAVAIVESAQAVFKHQGKMSEVATHKNWAQMILLRAQSIGVKNTDRTFL